MIPQARRVALALLAAFVALSAGLVYWQVVRGNSLARDRGNPRVAEQAKTADRGRIVDRNGKVLVESRPRADGSRSRTYAVPSLAQTIGYVSTRFGVSGLEQSYNQFLSGAVGSDPILGVWDDLLHLNRPGDQLQLTIDSNLQRVAADMLGQRPGAVIALDPHTGAVLAMVSAPNYDAAQIDSLGDKLLADPNKPLLNRAAQGRYPPGSVYKVVTATAALDSGVVKPEDQYKCVNGVVISGFVVQCTNAPPGQTQWDFLHAFAYSINATFAQVTAEQLGSDRFLDYSKRFGIDEPLHFDVDTATSTTSRAGGSLNPVLLASSGFGQGQILVTPLQMALVAATVANDGVTPEPYLVQEVRDGNGQIVTQHMASDRLRVMSSVTAAEMTQFMTTAVKEGFGEQAGLLGMDVAGKTGTAETGGPAADSWFIGFAPASHPKLVVAAVVEHGGAGSQVAAPIAKQLFQADGD